jgi:hypothetical protein
MEPPTFRLSVEDCRNIAAVATAYVSQGVWPYETYQRFATVIGVSQVLALWLGHQHRLEAAGRRSPEHGAKPSSTTVSAQRDTTFGSNGRLRTPRMKLVFMSFGSPATKSGI